jgi:hypothetical protein
MRACVAARGSTHASNGGFVELHKILAFAGMTHMGSIINICCGRRRHGSKRQRFR